MPPTSWTSKCALADAAPDGLADDREGLRQQVVERLAVGEPLAELVRLGAQLVVGERLNSGSSALIASTTAAILADLAVVVAEYLGK